MAGLARLIGLIAGGQDLIGDDGFTDTARGDDQSASA